MNISLLVKTMHAIKLLKVLLKLKAFDIRQKHMQLIAPLSFNFITASLTIVLTKCIVIYIQHTIAEHYNNEALLPLHPVKCLTEIPALY